MKKIIFLIALVLVLVSCGNNSTNVQPFKGNTFCYDCLNEDVHIHLITSYTYKDFTDYKIVVYKDSFLRYEEYKWIDSIKVIYYKYTDEFKSNNIRCVCVDSAFYDNIVWNDVEEYYDNYDGNGGKDTCITRIFYNDNTRRIVCKLGFGKEYRRNPYIYSICSSDSTIIDEYLDINNYKVIK